MPAFRPRRTALRSSVILSATALVAGAAVYFAGTTAQADPLPGGLGPCTGDDCPDEYPDSNNNGPIIGHDDSVNVYVGADFSVRGSAAEAEGRVVVMGDFDQDKDPDRSQVYNVGAAGVGSRVPPPNGSDYMQVGGDLTVADEERLLAVDGASGESGIVRVAGTATGTVEPPAEIDPTAVDQYDGLRDQLTEASLCYAYPDGSNRRETTGTVANQGFQTVFTGDGTSMLQVFAVDADLVASGGGQQSLTFAGIPDGATILVNVYGDARTLNINSGPELEYRDRLLWNFPDATEVNLHGTTQFRGSVLTGNQSSVTELTMSGTNGRMYLTGSLVHGNSDLPGSGQEMHSYPFNGDLPNCDVEPSPSETTPSEPTPSEPTPSGDTSTDPTPSHDATTGPAASTAPGGGGETVPAADGPGLPVTGSSAVLPLAVGAAALLLGSAVVFAAKRRRA